MFAPDQAAQAVQQLAAGQAAGLRGAGAGRVRRVEHVDVDRHVDRCVAEPGAHPLDHRRQPVELVVVGADDLEAEHAVVGQVGGRVERAADADVQAVLGVEQALLAGPAERRAVGERRTEVGVPGVEVRVEVQHGDRAVVAVQRAQQRQRDGVVAAEGDQLGAAVAQLVGSALDGGDRLGEVERVDRDVAGVGHLLYGERLDVQPRVVGPQQLGRARGCGPGRTGRRAGRRRRSRTGRRPRRRRCAAPRRCGAAGRRWRGRRSGGRGWRRPVRSVSAASCTESPGSGARPIWTRL